MDSNNPQNQLDPEIIKVFKSINDNLTEEQIEFIVDSSKPKGNPISGQIYGPIINMLYLEDDNLASVIIEDNTGNTYILAVKPDELSITEEFHNIKINNLNNFRNRLQEAFNYQSSVSIFYEDNKIQSLVITKQILNSPGFLASNSSISSRAACCFPYPRCPKKWP